MDPRLARAREVLSVESQAIERLRERLGEPFLRAVELVIACEGHVIVTGMGKAGKIAEKISATLASTGTPSFFLHPAEAVHGDLGRCLEKDLLLTLSNSGSTGPRTALSATIFKAEATSGSFVIFPRIFEVRTSDFGDAM